MNALGPAALRSGASAGRTFFTPLTRCITRRGRARLTATVHDLTAFLMPELHTPGNVRADRIFAERILKRADGLIAVPRTRGRTPFGF